MAKGFKINGTDFDDVFEPTRSGFSSVTFTGLSPTCTYMARTGNASNPNASGYWKYNGTAYDAHPKGYLIPKSLTVGGSWSNPQYISTAPDTTGLSFTATYQDGSTGSVSVSVSPSKWSSAVGTQTATFSYSYNGVSVSATKSASVVKPHNWSSWKKVGGKIFYINTSGTATYEFKNASGTAVSAPSVGTDCTNWTYRYDLDEYNKDRFYVFCPGRAVGGNYWSRYGSSTGATGNSIGSGRTNTNTAYNAITDHNNTIWIVIYIFNVQQKIGGCSDWYLPCPAEFEKLTSSGVDITSYTYYSSDFWTSREYEYDSNYAYYYYKSGSGWTLSINEKASYSFAGIPIRSF